MQYIICYDKVVDNDFKSTLGNNKKKLSLPVTTKQKSHYLCIHQKESCQSDRMGRPRKPLNCERFRGFESLTFRFIISCL